MEKMKSDYGEIMNCNQVEIDQVEEMKKDPLKYARAVKEMTEKDTAMREENKAMAKFNLQLTAKERKYLNSLSKKDRKRFINKSLGRDEDHGISGPSKKTPFGKRYF